MRTTVLLLDADPLVRDTVEAMLTAINCTVVLRCTVNNGHACLKPPAAGC